MSQSLTASVRMLMKPIIRILMRNGFTYKSFAALCKTLYVEVADDYGIRGRPTNISRIAILTGLDRKEIRRIKTLLAVGVDQQEVLQIQDRISRILSAWHTQPDFTRKGKPNVLKDDNSTQGFDALLKQYGGDIPTTTWRKELVRLDLVKQSPSGFKVLKRNYFPSQGQEQTLLRASSVIYELCDTLFHNLYLVSDAEEGQALPNRFERRASNNSVDPKHVRAFYEFLDVEGQKFLEATDIWLSAHEDESSSDTDNGRNRAIRLSVSLFGFDNPHIQRDEQS